MKRLILASILCVSTAWAATKDLKTINMVIAGALAAFQNDEVTFVATVDEWQILSAPNQTPVSGVAAASGLLRAESSTNLFELIVHELRLDSLDASNPTVGGTAALKLDMIEAFGQDAFNGYGQNLDDLFHDVFHEFVDKYGAAAQLNIQYTHLELDQDNNLATAGVLAQLKIDLNLLPPDIQAESVPFTQVDARMTFDRFGGELSVESKINPSFSDLQRDFQTIEDMLDALANKDQDTIDSITGFAEYAVIFAKDLVGL